MALVDGQVKLGGPAELDAQLEPSAQMRQASSVATALLEWASAHDGAGPVSLREAQAFADLLGFLGGHCDSAYAECRLGGIRQLDLLVSFRKGSTSVHALSRMLAERGSLAPLSTRAAWQETRAFVERWMNEEDPVSGSASAIWLEFDDVVGPLERAAPSLSACVAPGYGLHWNARSTSSEVLGKNLLTVHQALTPKLVESLQSCLRELPANGRFIHLSFMSARPSRALKLYGVCEAHELAPYLRRIGLGDHVRDVEELLAACGARSPAWEEVYFDLNLSALSGEVPATFGVAFSQQNQQSTEPHDPSRRGLLGRCVSLGLCSQNEADALAEWVEQARRSRALSGDLRDHHWLDLKAVSSDQGWSLKAYLGFTQLRTPFLLGSRAAGARTAQLLGS